MGKRTALRPAERVGLAALAAAVAVLAAVAAGIGTEGASAAGRGLERFGGCEGLMRHVKRHAARLVGPYGFEGAGVAPPAADVAETAAGEPLPALSAEAEPGVDFSTTNVQEAGIDEPDAVKSDGSRIFAIVGATVYAVDASGAEPRLAGSVQLDAGGDRLFLHGDRLLVIASESYAVPERPGTSEIAPPPYRLRTTLTELDVADPGAMRVARTLSVDGNFVAARLAGSTLRVVVSGFPELDFTSPDGSSSADLEEAELRNRGVVAASGVRDWLPFYRLDDREQGLAVTRQAVACGDVARPVRFSGLGMLTVLTSDLERGIVPVDSDAVLASATLPTRRRGASTSPPSAGPTPGVLPRSSAASRPRSTASRRPARQRSTAPAEA